MAREKWGNGEHLELRGRTIFYRRALPRILREVAGQREFIRSPITRGLGEAEEMGNVLTRARLSRSGAGCARPCRMRVHANWAGFG